MEELLIASLIVVGAVFLMQRHQSGGSADPSSYLGPQFYAPNDSNDEPTQEASMIEEAAVALTPSTYTPANVAPDTAARNLGAFLSMIAYSEGTSGPDGYRTLFGGGTFDSFADHPRVYVPFGNTSSSAAGRYQILARTWDGLRAKLGLPDFSPASQDAAAIELIRQRGALSDAQAGRVTDAIYKVRKVWASLPGAGYGQGERSAASLIAAYNSNGGTLAA